MSVKLQPGLAIENVKVWCITYTDERQPNQTFWVGSAEKLSEMCETEWRGKVDFTACYILETTVFTVITHIDSVELG